MTSRLAVVAVDCHDPRLLADFWTAALDWKVLDVDDDGIGIGPRDGTSPTIDFLVVPDSKTIKNRLHFDLRADGSSTEDEIARLEGLGARRVDIGQSDEVTWTVLADPEGNEFCVLGRTWQEAHGPESGA